MFCWLARHFVGGSSVLLRGNESSTGENAVRCSLTLFRRMVSNHMYVYVCHRTSRLESLIQSSNSQVFPPQDILEVRFAYDRDRVSPPSRSDRCTVCRCFIFSKRFSLVLESCRRLCRRFFLVPTRKVHHAYMIEEVKYEVCASSIQQDTLLLGGI